MRKQTLLLTLLLAPFFCLAQWAQLGSDIGTSQDSLAEKISMNATGTIVAIGQPGGKFFNPNSPNPSKQDTIPGKVKVYELINGDWMQKGSTLNEVAGLEQFGWHLKLNANGDILAVIARSSYTNAPGYATVYKWNGIDWALRGDTIFGDAYNDAFGSSFDFSSDGNRIIIGSPSDSTYASYGGKATVYEWNGTNYSKIGSDIYSSQYLERCGLSVTIAGSGNRIVVTQFEDPNAEIRTIIRVFDWINNDWLEIDTLKSSDSDLSSPAIKTNETGNVIVVGGKMNPTSSSVNIFKIDNNQIIPKGGEIKGASSQFPGLNGNFAITNDGNTLFLADDSPNSAGVKIMKFKNNNWVTEKIIPFPTITRLQASASGDRFAFIDVSESVGIVYENTQVSSVSSLSTNNHLSIYPNPTNSVVDLNSDAIVTSYELYTIDGRLIISENGLWNNNLTIDLATQNSGIYLLKVKTNNSTETVRINKN